MGRILLAKVEARIGNDMYVSRKESHGDYNSLNTKKDNLQLGYKSPVDND